MSRALTRATPWLLAGLAVAAGLLGAPWQAWGLLAGCAAGTWRRRRG